MLIPYDLTNIGNPEINHELTFLRFAVSPFCTALTVFMFVFFTVPEFSSYYTRYNNWKMTKLRIKFDPGYYTKV